MSNKTEDFALDIQKRLEKPIVLVGMMGVGKTRLGRMLSDVLELPFFDSDNEIEKAADMTIPEIFEKFGESYFRQGERRVIKRLLASEPGVVATGGGAITNEETAAEIWNNTISIWLRAPLAVMVERTGRTDNRPLLKQGNPEEILKRLSAKRYPIYEKADIVVESDDRPAEEILDQMLEKLDLFIRKGRIKAG